MRRLMLSVSGLAVSIITLFARGGLPTDSVSLHTSSSPEQFHWKQLILPGSLIAIGSFGAGNGWFKSVNHEIRDGIYDIRGDCYFHADDYLQYLPAAAYLSVGFFPGASARHSLKERLCIGVSAYACMAVVANLLKYTVREERPDSSSRNSFPSGHTATAFTGAELMRLEYGPWIGAAGYTIAFGVAFLRIYNNRHWFNDVIAGAGIGILSAHVGYWLMPLERRWFHRWLKDDIVVTPYGLDSRTLGFSVCAVF